MLPGHDPDALTPDVVASRSFGFAKRGYEAREVQDFLRDVAEELRVRQAHAAELAAQVDQLRDELDEARQLDEDQLAEALGEETRQVLAAARSAAEGIRARAEDEARAVVAQAARDADQVRADTEREAAGHLQAAALTVAEARDQAVATAERATVEAAETVEAARQRGREMVAEAQAVRERMLKDLARRRKVLRQQIDQLQAGRDRLLAAYEVVHRTAAEATGELAEVLDAARDAARAAVAQAGGTPGDVDLDIVAAIEQVRLERGIDPDALTTDELEEVDEPLSGEVPEVVVGDDEDVQDVEVAEDVQDVEEAMAPEPADGAEVDAAEGEGTKIRDDAAEGGGTESRDDAAGGEGDESHDDAADGAGRRSGKADRRRSLFGRAGEDVPKAPPPAEHEGRFSSAVRVFARAEDGTTVVVEEPLGSEVEPVAVADGPEAPDRAAAGGLFARLRQEQAEVERVAAESAPAEPRPEEPEPEEPEPEGPGPGPGEPVGSDTGLVARRDRAVADLVATLRRRLKRTLADEENEVLDALRRHAGPPEVDLLLPGIDDHLRRYADAALPTLAAAATAGLDFLADGWPELVAEAPRTRVGDLAEGAAEDLVVPLRQALARQLSAGEGTDELVEAVRATYRDWRQARIDAVADMVGLTAFHRALAEHVADGVQLRWVVGASTEPAPDCAANAEAAPVGRGEAFPDGSAVPPCAAGCRCLVVPVG